MESQGSVAERRLEPSSPRILVSSDLSWACLPRLGPVQIWPAPGKTCWSSSARTNRPPPGKAVEMARLLAAARTRPAADPRSSHLAPVPTLTVMRKDSADSSRAVLLG